MIPVDESEYLPPLVLQQVVLEAGNVSPLPPRQLDIQIDRQKLVDEQTNSWITRQMDMFIKIDKIHKCMNI